MAGRLGALDRPLGPLPDAVHAGQGARLAARRSGAAEASASSARDARAAAGAPPSRSRLPSSAARRCRTARRCRRRRAAGAARPPRRARADVRLRRHSSSSTDQPNRAGAGRGQQRGAPLHRCARPQRRTRGGRSPRAAARPAPNPTIRAAPTSRAPRGRRTAAPSSSSATAAASDRCCPDAGAGQRRAPARAPRRRGATGAALGRAHG